MSLRSWTLAWCWLFVSGLASAQVRPPSQGSAHARAKVDVHGRIYFQYRTGKPDGELTQSDDPEHQFVIDSARVGVDFKRGPLRMQLELELFDADATGEIAPAARDVWIQYRIARALRVRIGQFKKPFSLLRTESRNDLPFVFRGMVVGRLVDDLGYGGRDIGVMAAGRVGKAVHVSYALGVFNGLGANDFESDPNAAKDLAGRMEVGWKKLVSLGLELSHRSMDRDTHSTSGGTLYGADLSLKLGGLHGLVEGHVGRDPGLYTLPPTAGAIGAAAYRVPLRKDWAIEPLVGREMYVPDTRRALRYFREFVGLNLYATKQLRLMLDAEQTHSPARAEPTRAFVGQIAYSE